MSSHPPVSSSPSSLPWSTVVVAAIAAVNDDTTSSVESEAAAPAVDVQELNEPLLAHRLIFRNVQLMSHRSLIIFLFVFCLTEAKAAYISAETLLKSNTAAAVLLLLLPVTLPLL